MWNAIPPHPQNDRQPPPLPQQQQQQQQLPDAFFPIPARGNSLTPASKPLPDLPSTIPQDRLPPRTDSVISIQQRQQQQALRRIPSLETGLAEQRGDSPDGGGLQKMVRRALECAEVAVRLDGEAQYGRALEGYCDTILLFEWVMEKADEAMLKKIGVLSDKGKSTAPPQPDLTKENKKRLISLRNTYVRRVTTLLATLPPEYTASYNRRAALQSGSPFLSQPQQRPQQKRISSNPHPSYDTINNIILTADPSHNAEPPEPPPTSQNPDHKPFYLMRLLAKSMDVGGYVTPTGGLYCPRYIWTQPGAKFTALEAKTSACESILSLVTRLRNVDATDTVRLDQELEAFENGLEPIRNALSKKLRFIERDPSASNFNLETSSSTGSINSLASGSSTASGLKSPEPRESRVKSFTTRLTKSISTLRSSKSGGETALYISLLIRLFTQAQILDKWISYYENLPPATAVVKVRSRLRRISEFFNGVVGFVKGDLEGLVEKFLKKVRAVITE